MKKNIKLKIGMMKTTELADWFQMSYSTFRKKKKEKLEELKDYAEYDEVYGGVKIKKILNEEYHKKENPKEIIYNAFDKEWNKDGLDSCTNVTLRIYRKYEDQLSVAESTVYKYTIAARNEFYGKPFQGGGKLGNCRYIWAKVVGTEPDGTKVLELFTEEEEKIKKTLMKKYFSTDAEKEIMIAEMVERGELTKEEAYDTLVRLKHLTSEGFMAFKDKLEKNIGSKIIKGTIIEKNINLLNWEM